MNSDSEERCKRLTERKDVVLNFSFNLDDSRAKRGDNLLRFFFGLLEWL